MSTAAQAGSGVATIRMQGIGHTYKGGVTALDGVDLELGKGLFGLLGPNGAGKSTLMKILCTLLEPSRGSASVGGHDVVKQRRKARQLLGYLPQEFGAWRPMRVREVLDTLARLSGVPGKGRKARVTEVLGQVGLSEVADRKVKKLSGGMLRRLGVAQALVHEPQVLVVDEPTVGLDPKERQRFRRLMAEMSQERTIVLSTHIMADLGASCRDLALIDRGKIVFRGSPTALIESSRGRVFQMTVGEGVAENALDQVEVVSKTRDAAGIQLRAVATDTNLPEGARPVDEPTIEEAYLAFMAARGRAEAISAEEQQ